MKVEYLPWAYETLREAISCQKAGFLPTLDLELTARCSGASCIYCDSKPNVSPCGMQYEMDFETLKTMLCDAKKNGLKWVYTCGLGEPVEDDNFWNLIELMKDNNIHLSMFSNGIFINDIYKARQLKRCGVNVILKMDTFDNKKFDRILGKKGVADKIYFARDLLLEAGYGNSGNYTDLAFSIVPTTLSYDGIPEVIKFAKKHGIFASIGELENAGEVMRNRLDSVIGLNSSQIISLKKLADDYIGGCYMRPICPCVITGVHIDNLGNCVVDRKTGLNCKWFLLENPDVKLIGNIKEINIMQLFRAVKEYRLQCFKDPSLEADFDISYVFGGCGGNPSEILSLAKTLI